MLVGKGLNVYTKYEWAMLVGKGLLWVYKIRMGHACLKGGLMGIQNTNRPCLLERRLNWYTKYEWAMVVGKVL